MRRSNNIVELKEKKGGKSAQGINHPPGPRLLPLKRAAECLGLSLWSLRERIWAGDIPVVRFNGGRKMFIDTQDLEDFIAQNKERVV